MKNEQNYLFYCESRYNSEINNKIIEVLPAISKFEESEKFNFIYLPLLWNNSVSIGFEFFKPLFFSFPSLNLLTENECWAFYRKAISSLKTQDIYNEVIKEINELSIEGSFFLQITSRGKVKVFNIPSFDNVIEVINSISFYNDVLYSSDLTLDVSDELSYSVKQEIQKIKNSNGYSALAEAVIYMLCTLKNEYPEALKKIKPIVIDNQLLDPLVAPSPLIIDKHYKIFLPNYGNIEVKMNALPKAIYLLYLKNPEGIRFKELYLYKSELLSIYNKVTNKYDNQEIENTIDNLLDVTQSLISQKCSRIKEAFRLILDEHIACYYYISGDNGESKKIRLPQSLIEWK